MKGSIVLAVLLFGNVCYGEEHIKYVTEMRAKMPPMYAINHTRCANETNGRYCLAHASLRPIGTKPQFWKLIEERQRSKTHYDRTLVDRGICVPRTVDENDVGTAVNQILEEEFSKYNLTHVVHKFDCREDQQPASTVMKLIGLLMVIYNLFVIFATVYDKYLRNPKADVSKLQEWILMFSITANWDKLVNHKRTNSDYKNLEFLQGIRFFNMSLVILAHVKLVWVMVYARNPETLEDIYNKYPTLTAGVEFFLVQTFFLISSWLVTNQILEIYRSNGKFTVKDGAILLFNRIMRYVPSLLVLIIGLVSPLPTRPPCNGTLAFDFIKSQQQNCVDYWWMTLLQVNNLVEIYQMCNVGTWYISIDTQYYLITIIVLYFILSRNLNPTKTITALVFVAVGIQTFLNWKRNLLSNEYIHLESLRRYNFLRGDVAMTTQYFSFSSSWASSLIGIGIGMIYFYTKTNEEIQPYEKYLYTLAFGTVPVLAVVLNAYPFGPSLTASILGSLVKPIWCIGIGLGFLAISRNALPESLSFIKSACLNKYAVLMGNFSYSTYLIHFQIVFLKGLNDLVVGNFYTFTTSFCRDYILSWICGIGFALFIEQPGANVLKKFLPQVKKQKPKVESQTNKHTKQNGSQDTLNNNGYKNK